MEVDKVGAITCYRCDKPGHRKSECRVPAYKIKKKKDKGQGGSKKDKKNLKCYKCDKTGHFARECRSGNKKEQGAAKGVDEKQLTEQEEEDIFLATTGVVNGLEKAPVPLTTEAETDIGEINNISTEGNRRKTYLYGKVESSQNRV